MKLLSRGGRQATPFICQALFHQRLADVAYGVVLNDVQKLRRSFHYGRFSPKRKYTQYTGDYEAGMDIVQKILCGGPGRASRLHDEKGNLVSLKTFIAHAPHAFITGFGKKFFDKRPVLPWISYDAIKVFEGFLDKSKTVLEFGSGMSTTWYAQRAGEVYSVDDYEPWYQKVKSILEERKINNTHYEFLRGDAYAGYMAESGKKFDLIMIDGSIRGRCAEKAIKLVADGGIIYLDNSDKHSGPEGGDTRVAEEILLAFARERDASVQYFVDFAPTEFFVQQGMMVSLNNWRVSAR